MIYLDDSTEMSYKAGNVREVMLKKFATQLEGQTLEELRKMAHHEGRQVQSLVNDAVKSYLQAKRDGFIRPNVLHAIERSNGEFGSLYRALIGKG